MKCPKCQRENEPAGRFCIFCGAPLPPPEAKPPAEKAQGQAQDPLGQMQILQQEVRQLRELLTMMNDRLVALERTRGVAVTPTPAVEKPEVAATPAEVRPELEAVPGVAKEEAALRKPREWEQILGGNWLARVGVVALIIGIAFFLKFAIDNNWLGPASRVILGIVAGLGMVGGGYYWRNKYPTLSQALSGGGIAVLYISIFAAFAMLRLLNIYAAVGLLFLVSGASALLALRQNSMALAIIGVLGAFIAPFALGAFSWSAGGVALAGTGFQLLLYVMIVDLGVIALSTLRNWQWFTLLGLFGSLMTFAAWHDRFGARASLIVSEGSLTIFFLIFVGATMLYHLVWRRTSKPFDYALMVINAAAYFGVSYGLMASHLRIWMGGFSLLLAIFYGGLAYIALRRITESRTLTYFALGIALAFLTIAMPVQMGDRAWTTIAWAVEGVVLIWLSITLKLGIFRSFGYAVFIITAGRLLFFDTVVNLRNFQPILNERVLAFLFGIAALYVTGYLLWREKKAGGTTRSLHPVFLVAANFFTILVLSLEFWNYFGKQLIGLTPMTDSARIALLHNAQNLSLTAVWAVYAVVLLVIGIIRRWRSVRLWALGLLFVPVIKVFVYDVWALQTVYRIIAFVGLGLLLLISAYLYQRYSKIIRGFIASK